MRVQGHQALVILHGDPLPGNVYLHGGDTGCGASACVIACAQWSHERPAR